MPSVRRSTVINTRYWRIAFITVPVAVAISMFALESPPAGLKPPVPPDGFDTSLTSEIAREMAASAPEPTAGSESDRILGELVQARFSGLDGVEVAEQRFSGGGEDLRNVIAVLPGSSERQVALIAGRDVAAGSGASTSIAATAALVELATVFSGSTHEKTLVFVSTDGASIGALGAKRFATDYSDADKLDAIVALSDPAAQDFQRPLVVPWGTSPENTSVQLQRTAADLVTRETAVASGNEGPVSEFGRLVFPSGFGEQAPLVGDGLDSVRITSAGERPSDSNDPLDEETLSGIGRGTLSVLLALDAHTGQLEHGPSTYIGVAGNLLPGWTLALFALALLIPSAAVASVSMGASARSPLEAVRAVARPITRWAIPPLVALMFLYVVSLIGLIPDLAFPFVPGTVPPGAGGWVGIALVIAVWIGVAVWLHRRRGPAATHPDDPAGALALGVSSVLLLWPINPYLSLCLSIALLIWLFAASPNRRSRSSRICLVALGLLPLLGVLAELAGRLGWGPDLGWSLVYMVADRQIGFTSVLFMLLCFSAGLTIATLPPGPASPDTEPEELPENPYA